MLPLAGGESWRRQVSERELSQLQLCISLQPPVCELGRAGLLAQSRGQSRSGRGSLEGRLCCAARAQRLAALPRLCSARLVWPQPNQSARRSRRVGEWQKSRDAPTRCKCNLAPGAGQVLKKSTRQKKKKRKQEQVTLDKFALALSRARLQLSWDINSQMLWECVYSDCSSGKTIGLDCAHLAAASFGRRLGAAQVALAQVADAGAHANAAISSVSSCSAPLASSRSRS